MRDSLFKAFEQHKCV